MAADRTAKNTSSRTNPAGSDQRKREVQGRIQKTSSDIEKHRKNAESKKRKLQEFSNTGIDGVAPEHEEEYRNVEEEFHNLGKTLEEHEAELQRLQQEEADIGGMGQDKDEDKDLFVPTSGQGSSSTEAPGLNLTNPNGQSRPLIIGQHDDDDDDEIGFTPAQAREATGQSDSGTIVAWRQQDRSKPVIVMYGPRNAAKYERSTAAREDNDFDEDEVAQFGPDKRLGDVKDDKKKFVRRKRELVSILGLAYNCDLDDLQPREKGEKRRLPPLEIWVKWKIDGKIKRAWEIRSSIRHLFSNAKKADTYIYDAAKWHAKRHLEWLEGKREAKDSSPSPEPNSRLSPTPAPTGSKPIKTEGDDNSPPKRSPMLEYREQWCELNGIDLEELKTDRALQGEFLKSWNEIKDGVY